MFRHQEIKNLNNQTEGQGMNLYFKELKPMVYMFMAVACFYIGNGQNAFAGGTGGACTDASCLNPKYCYQVNKGFNICETSVDSTVTGGESISGPYVGPQFPNSADSVAVSPDGNLVFATTGQSETNTQTTFTSSGNYLGRMAPRDNPNPDVTAPLMASSPFFLNPIASDGGYSGATSGALFFVNTFSNNKSVCGSFPQNSDGTTNWSGPEAITESGLEETGLSGTASQVTLNQLQNQGFVDSSNVIQAPFLNVINTISGFTINGSTFPTGLTLCQYLNGANNGNTCPAGSLYSNNFVTGLDNIIDAGDMASAENKIYAYMVNAYTGNSTVSFKLSRTLADPSAQTQDAFTIDAFNSFNNANVENEIWDDLLAGNYITTTPTTSEVLPGYTLPSGYALITPTFYDNVTSCDIKTCSFLNDNKLNPKQQDEVYNILIRSIDPTINNMDNRRGSQYVNLSCKNLLQDTSTQSIVTGLAADGLWPNSGLGAIYKDSQGNPINYPVGGVYVASGPNIYVFAAQGVPEPSSPAKGVPAGQLMAVGVINLSASGPSPLIDNNGNKVEVVSVASLAYDPNNGMIAAEIKANVGGNLVPAMVEFTLKNSYPNGVNHLSVQLPNNYTNGYNCTVAGAVPNANCFNADNWTDTIVPYLTKVAFFPVCSSTMTSTAPTSCIENAGPIAIAPQAIGGGQLGKLLIIDNAPITGNAAVKEFALWSQYTTAEAPSTLTFKGIFGDRGGLYSGEYAGKIEQVGRQVRPTNRMRGLAVAPNGDVVLAQDTPHYVVGYYNADSTLKWRHDGFNYVGIDSFIPGKDEMESGDNGFNFDFSLNQDGSAPGTEQTWMRSTFNGFLYPNDQSSGVTVNGVIFDSIKNKNKEYSLNKFLSVSNGTLMQIKGFDPLGFGVPLVSFFNLNSDGTLNTINGQPWNISQSNKPQSPPQNIFRAYFETMFPDGFVKQSKLSQIQVDPSCVPTQLSQCADLSAADIWTALTGNSVISKYGYKDVNNNVETSVVFQAALTKLTNCATSKCSSASKTNSEGFLVPSSNNSKLDFTPGQQQEIYNVLTGLPNQGEVMTQNVSNYNQGDRIFDFLVNPIIGSESYLSYLQTSGLVKSNGIVVQGLPVNPVVDQTDSSGHSILKIEFPDDYSNILKYLTDATAGSTSFIWVNSKAQGTVNASDFDFLDVEAIGGCGGGDKNYAMGSYADDPQLLPSMRIAYMSGSFNCMNLLTLQGRTPIGDKGQYILQYVYNNREANPLTPNIQVPIGNIFKMSQFQNSTGTTIAQGTPYDAICWVHFDKNGSLYVIGDATKYMLPNKANDKLIGRYLSRFDPPKGYVSVEGYLAMAQYPNLAATWTVDLGMEVKSAAQDNQMILIGLGTPQLVAGSTTSWAQAELYDTIGNFVGDLSTNQNVFGKETPGDLDFNDDVSLAYHQAKGPNDRNEYVALLEHVNGSNSTAYRIIPGLGK